MSVFVQWSVIEYILYFIMTVSPYLTPAGQHNLLMKHLLSQSCRLAFLPALFRFVFAPCLTALIPKPYSVSLYTPNGSRRQTK